MLFTAPAFMFVFLPFSLIFCVLIGKNRKKLCLGMICAVFHVLLNIHEPHNMIWLPLIIVYAYFAARLTAINKSKIISVLLGCVPLVWLLLVRQLAYVGDYSHPIAITLPAICASSYIWDARKREDNHKGFWSLWLYLTFFPIMIIGPFLKYSRFCELVDGGNMEITLEKCSSGVRLFALGFIKRIAIGAVLIDGYTKIFAYSWESPNPVIIVLLLVLIYFGAFFSLSGYYDMATGISRMYGLDVPQIKANPLFLATPAEYLGALFGGICDWTREYVTEPICTWIGKRGSALVGVCMSFFCTALFVRAELWVILLLPVLVAFAMSAVALRIDRVYSGYTSGKFGVRALFGVLSMLVLGAFWIFVTIGASTPDIFDYLSDVTSGNAEYQTDLILISFSGVKYACVAAVGILLVLPYTKWVSDRYEKASERTRGIIDYGSLVLLLALFVFAVIFFLPQFPMYNDAPFGYIVV